MVCTNRSNLRVVKQHILSFPHQSSHTPCPCPSQEQDAARNGASLWSGIVFLCLQETLKYRTKKLRLHAMLFVVVKPVPDKARLPVRVSSLWPLFLVIIHSLCYLGIWTQRQAWAAGRKAKEIISVILLYLQTTQRWHALHRRGT